MPRTNIELTDEQLGELRLEAARRGGRGFSPLVQEAVDLYLRELRRRREAGPKTNGSSS